MSPTGTAAAVVALGMSALLPATALGQEAGEWHYWASIYGYGPSISSKTTFPTVPGGEPGINISAQDILDHLKFAFMGSFDAQNGKWGYFTDLVYFDLGGGKSAARDFTIGDIGLPASTNANFHFDLKGTAWTVAGQYRLVSDPNFTMNALAGARYLHASQELRWEINGDLGTIPPGRRAGDATVDANVVDAIVGVKGRWVLGEDGKWYVPYYLDVGTGQSDRTVQAAAGIAYSFKWGDLVAMYRYLDYGFKSGKPVQDLSFTGPMIGAAFHW